MPDVPVDLEKIRRLRERAGMTQAQAAVGAGFDVPPERAAQAWWQIESGRRPNPTVATLEAIAAVLGVTACDLLTNPKSKRASRQP